MHEPNPQTVIEPKDFKPIVSAYRGSFTRLYSELGIKVDTVKRIAELGCGRGPIVQAALDAFPLAHIDAVDAFDILIQEIRSNPRVEFHKGTIVDILKSKKLSGLDAAILRGLEDRHGLNETNIQLLYDILGVNGLLITDFDNNFIEEQNWFREKFRLVWGQDISLSLRAWEKVK